MRIAGAITRARLSTPYFRCTPIQRRGCRWNGAGAIPASLLARADRVQRSGERCAGMSVDHPRAPICKVDEQNSLPANTRRARLAHAERPSRAYRRINCIAPGAQEFQSGLRGERESRRYRSKTLERSHAAALILDAVLVADQHASGSMSALRQIVQPASALDVRSGKDPADFLGVLVLVITHVHAFVVRQIEDLNLPRVMRHNIFECLLNAAQVPVDAADNLDPSP